MKPPIQKSGKSTRTADRIRRQIVDGTYPPGLRLPVWSELAPLLGVTKPTLSNAVSVLKKQNFLATGRRGTFVSEHPPHLNRFAIVYNSHPGDSCWTRNMQTIESIKHEVAEQMQVKIDSCHDVRKDSQARNDLLMKMRENLYCGVLLMSPDSFEERDIPAGFPHYFMSTRCLGSNCLLLDHNSFVRKAVDALVEESCKRIGIISNRQWKLDVYRDQLEASGLPSDCIYLQTVAATQDPGAAENLTALLFSLPDDQRPDGLIITDDNLTIHVFKGLLQKQIRIPKELRIVEHCNFPSDNTGLFQTIKLGYDKYELLTQVITNLKSVRDGIPVKTPLTVKAKYVKELNHE